MKSKLLKKYFLIGVSVSVIFFIIGTLSHRFLMMLEKESFEFKRHHKDRIHREFRGGPHSDIRPPHPPRGRPDFRNPKHRNRLFKILGIQILAILLAVTVTVIIIFVHFKGRTKEIQRILNQIKEGDLKARMPIGDSDEFGLAMGKFNEMADEIEQLVNKLRKTEATRRELLGELAHDIRTPLASISNLLELQKKDVSPLQRNELVDMSTQEVKYISRLVEDLLFLGKIEEPSYQTHNEDINLRSIVDEVAYQIAINYPDIEFKIEGDSDCKYDIDPVLANRLFRNALENAFSFARSRVTVKYLFAPGYIRFQVIDDGPGVESHIKNGFGIKKFSRSASQREDRISVGLGSVIMRSIIENYGGEISLENNRDEGSCLNFSLSLNV